MIKTKSFTLKPKDLFLLNLKQNRLNLVFYAIFPIFLYYYKTMDGRTLNTIDFVIITLVLTAGYVPFLNTAYYTFNKNNSTFYESRVIEFTDQFLIETRDDGSMCQERLAKMQSIKETKDFYFVYNSAISCYPIKKDSFLTAEDKELFQVAVVDKFKKNGFIEL